MPSLPNWKLRRLSSRVLRVLERHKDRSPAVGSYALNLKPAAEAFIGTYDQLQVLESERIHELAQGKAAVEELLRRISPWVAQVAASKTVAGFDASGFTEHSDVPDDVIKDAERLVELVKKHQELEPDAMAYTQALLDDLTPALETARKEWVEAEGVKNEYQLLVVQNQANVQRFSDLLIGFRRSLAAVIGRNHPDHQTLRSSKIDREVLEEGEAADLPPSLIPTQVAPEVATENA